MFEAWLIEDQRHLDYFNKTDRFYREGSGLNGSTMDPGGAWNQVWMKIRLNERRKKRKRIATLASAAASVIILTTLFVLLPHGLRTGRDVIPAISPSIPPGTDKAMLILDDGSTIDLSLQKELSIQSGGTTITSRGTSIEYQHREETGAALLKYNMLTVPRGGEFFMTLADGTSVWLNSGTSLRYPVQFASGAREVELLGEAYFEVARDEQRPFRILSGAQVVEVIGTSFNISSYADDEQISTTLISGKVNVYLTADPAVSQILTPSHQSVFHKTSGLLTQAEVNADEYTSWKEGWFRFEDQDLSEMMKTLSRWYDVSVTFENKVAMNLKFTGNIRRYENFEKILEIIERTKEVEFEITDKQIIIK